MQISDESARELIEVHEEEFRERLSLEEARAIGARLVELYLKLAEPLSGGSNQGSEGDY
jgi:hypothetical protein